MSETLGIESILIPLKSCKPLLEVCQFAFRKLKLLLTLNDVNVEYGLPTCESKCSIYCNGFRTLGTFRNEAVMNDVVC